jgi:hypothetical protein
VRESVVVRVFDFDDTLAHTEGTIRILHYENGEPKDTTAWLGRFGITGKLGPLDSVEITTGSFREYTKATSSLISSGDLKRQEAGHRVQFVTTDVVDFSMTAKIRRPKVIDSTIAVARQAFARGDIIGIITGRTGGESMIDITGDEVKITNAADIRRFMTKHGVPVDVEDIHCVGSLPGGVPHNKAEAMRSGFVEKYSPDSIVFYDDDVLNLAAVGAIDSRIHCIDSRDIGDGWGSPASVVDSARERRKRVSGWTRALERAGIIK